MATRHAHHCQNKWLTPSLKKLEPMKNKDMVFEKPRYSKVDRRKQSGKAVRSLFSTARSRKDKESPKLEELLGAFYSSCSTSAAFQYALPEIKGAYRPEDEINIDSSVDVVSRTAVPQSLTKFAANFQCAEDLWHFLPNYSTQEVAELEQNTRQQADCKLWIEHRHGRITASNAHGVLTKYRAKKMSESTALLNKIIGQGKILDLPAFKYGRQNEPLAADFYLASQKNSHKNLKVTTCGLFVLADSIFIAASPDRLVSCDCCGLGLLEIKCPISLAGQTIFDKAEGVQYLKKIGQKLSLNKKHQYYTQVQQQLGVAHMMWCDFMIYTNKDHFIERITLDVDRWTEICRANTAYFKDIVAPALITNE